MASDALLNAIEQGVLDALEPLRGALDLKTLVLAPGEPEEMEKIVHAGGPGIAVYLMPDLKTIEENDGGSIWRLQAMVAVYMWDANLASRNARLRGTATNAGLRSMKMAVIRALQGKCLNDLPETLGERRSMPMQTGAGLSKLSNATYLDTVVATVTTDIIEQ